MRILTFFGDYSYKKPEFFSGFICFCHIDKEETDAKIEKIASKLTELANGSKIILVPFAHLYEDVAESPIAKNIFDKLVNRIKFNNNDVFLAPFGITKELNLEVPADDKAIKFLNF